MATWFHRLSGLHTTIPASTRPWFNDWDARNWVLVAGRAA